VKKRFPGISGVNESVSEVLSPPDTLLYSNNYILSHKRGTIKKRGGSYYHNITGDVWGLGGYAKPTGSLKVPVGDIVLRHVRNGSTSTFSKIDWSDGSWDNISYASDFSSSNVGVGAITKFIQIGTKLAILSGKPAQLDDIDTGTISMLGGPAPSSGPTVAESVGAGSLGAGLYSCYFTFYNSTTGWESSPSPITDVTIAASKAIEWTGLPSTYAKAGVNFKRLYRTEVGGGEPFYFVASIALATTTYTDNIVALGEAGPEIGENDPPPSSSYLGEVYGNRFFIAEDDTLYFSKEFDGNYSRLEQFPDTNFISFGTRITGLKANERLGGLLIFRPPGFGIDLLRGTATDSFEIVPLFAELGTNFDTSISSRGESLVFWGSTGPVMIRDGRVITTYSEQMRERLRPFIEADYNSDLFVWSAWHPANNQYIWGVSAQNASAVAWGDFVSSVVSEWVDVTTGATATWEVAL
jgi:hypothetical protein